MAKIDGTELGEVLSGTIGDDEINGLGGNDVIDGGQDGQDTLNGGDGNDTLRGGLGSDTLNGDAGNDTLYGEAGDDTLNGGDGDDYLYDNSGINIFDGGLGNDRIYAYSNNATITAGEGNDLIYAYASYATIDAGDGNDSVVASGYADVTGGLGEDFIAVGSASNVDAGDDNDTIQLQGSNISLTTGSGSDTIVPLSYGYSNNVVTDFAAGDGGDIVSLSTLLGTLPSYPGGNPFATGHLILTQDGASTLLQVDYDGTAGVNTYLYTSLTLENVNVGDLTAFNFGGYGTDGSFVAGQTINGTELGEVLSGTIGDDEINGLGGNDVIDGGQDGQDTLNGGDGNDTLRGGLGSDTLNGDAGNDFLYGEAGDDTLNGGDGDDYLYDNSGINIFDGGLGNDRIYAYSNNATITAGEGNDLIYAYASYATIDAGDGNDSVVASGYADVTGGLGEDFIAVGSASNVDAGDDNDTIQLQGSNISLTTGSGSDTIVPLSYGYSNNVVTDFAAGDGGDIVSLSTLLGTLPSYPGGNPFATGHLILTQDGASTLLQVDYDGTAGVNTYLYTSLILENVNVGDLTAFNFGGYGTDGSFVAGQTINGTELGEVLSGTIGDDEINGLGGNDVIDGGQDGQDTLNGGDGNDTLRGGLGSDTLNGDAGNDFLYGEAGDDTLNGGDGDDYLYDNSGINIFDGGLGNDRIYAYSNNATITAGEGNDLIYAYASYATIDAGDGNDSVVASGYADVTGGLGEDFIAVGSASNVDAGDDNDTIQLQGSNISLTTGSGSDTIVPLSYGYSNNVVTEFAAGDGGDIVSLSTLLGTLPSYPGGNPFATGHLILTQDGASTLLQVDYDGTAGVNTYLYTSLTLENVNVGDLTAFNFGGYGTDGTIFTDPVAVDASATGDEDTKFGGQLTAVDPDSSDLIFALVDGPQHGSLLLNADGSWEYTPDANYNGSDSFTFTAADEQTTSEPATVELTINPVNDAPIALSGFSGGTYDEDAFNSFIWTSTFSDPDGDDLIFSLTNADGSKTYDWINIYPSFDASVDRWIVSGRIQPPSNWNEDVSLLITASDGLASTSLTTSFVFNPVNDAPLLTGNYGVREWAEDTGPAYSFGFSTRDYDFDDLTLSFSLADGSPIPDWVSVENVVSEDLEFFSLERASLVFRPPENWSGELAVVATGSDGITEVFGGVTFRITPVNDAPVLDNPLSDQSSDEDSALSFVIPGDAFSDVDGDILNYSATLANGDQLPAWLVFDASTREFSGTPPQDFNGSLDVEVTASDGEYEASDIFRLTIDPVNDAPVSVDDSYSTDEDVALVVATSGILANDSDADGDTLTAALVSDVSNGSLTLNADGNFSYTPNADFSGVDSFTYVANDGTTDSNEVTVTLTVNPVNDAPVLTKAQSHNILATDLGLANTYLPGNQMEASIGQFADGTYAAVWAHNGVLSIQRFAEEGSKIGGEQFFAWENFSFSPHVSTVGDDLLVIYSSRLVSDLDLVGQRIDSNGNLLGSPFIVSAISGISEQHAEVLQLANGNYAISWSSISQSAPSDIYARVYDPTDQPLGDAFLVNQTTAGEQGASDIVAMADGSFFVVWDNSLDETTGRDVYLRHFGNDGTPLSDEFLVNQVTADIQYSPRVSLDGAGNLIVTWTAVGQDGDSVGIYARIFDPQGTALTDEFLVNQTTEGGQTFSHVLGISDGTNLFFWAGEGVDGLGSYARLLDATGDPLSDEVLIGSFGFQFEAIEQADGSVILFYMENGDIRHLDLSIVELGNHIKDQSIDEETSFSFAVPENAFSDVDGDILSFGATLANGDPLPAWLVFDASTREFSGTPPQDFNGSLDVEVTASDGEYEANDVFRLTIDPVNDAPVSVDDSYSTDEDVALFVAASGILANDVDVDGDTQTAVLVSDVSNGSLTLNADGSFSYTPDTNFNGIDSFTYVANDGTSDGNEVTVTLTVDPVNDAPVATDDLIAVDEDAEITGNLLTGATGDTDVDGDLLEIKTAAGLVPGALIAGLYGTLIVQADGSYSYAADADITDTLAPGTVVYDKFDYVVSDGELEDTGRLTVTVTAIDDGVSITPSKGGGEILGSDGDDVIAGGRGQESISGGEGSDRIDGDSGDDTIDGGPGIDLLIGGKGNDVLSGGPGDDILIGGKGSDLMTGGPGRDIFIIDGPDKSRDIDTITDFEVGVDHLFFADGLSIAKLEELGGNTVITLSNRGELILLGVTGATESDLITTSLPSWFANNLSAAGSEALAMDIALAHSVESERLGPAEYGETLASAFYESTSSAAMDSLLEEWSGEPNPVATVDSVNVVSLLEMNVESTGFTTFLTHQASDMDLAAALSADG